MRVIELDIGVKVGVNSDGDIYSVSTLIHRSNGRIYNKRGVKIQPALDAYGYLRCTFSNKGKRQSVYVHRLVAMAYIPNPENKPTVNHINGNKTDNRVENLEWATQHEQKAHAIRNGLCDKNIAALEMSNQRRSISIQFDGVLYQSLRAASRATGYHPNTLKKYGEVITNEI